MKARQSYSRGFKGIWIPAELWLHPELTIEEVVLAAEIDSLDTEEQGCTATNEYLAEFLGLHPVRVSQVITHLKDLGIIYQESFDGRVRTLRSVKSDLMRDKVCLNESSRARTSLLRDNKEDNIEESSIPQHSKIDFVLGKKPKTDSKKPEKESRWVKAKKPYVPLIVGELNSIGLSRLFYEFLDGVYDKGQLNEQNVIRLIKKVKELYKQNPKKCERDLNYSWCKRYADIYSEDGDGSGVGLTREDRPKALAEMTPEEREEFERKLKDMPEY